MLVFVEFLLLPVLLLLLLLMLPALLVLILIAGTFRLLEISDVVSVDEGALIVVAVFFVLFDTFIAVAAAAFNEDVGGGLL